MFMRMKLVYGCLLLALSVAGCSADVGRAVPPAQANRTPVGPSPSPPAPVRYRPVSLPPPAGWVPYKWPNRPGSSVLSCALFSEREWRVSPDGEGVKMARYRDRHVQAALPFDIEKPSKPERGLAGDRHVLRVDDGWLVGFDAGEFGGALWWFSADGGRRVKLSGHNVAGLAESPAGVLTLVGFAHMGSDRGRLLLVREGPEGKRPVEDLADLGSAPTAFAAESPDSLIVATYERVVRVSASGAVEQLFAPEGDQGLPYPNSLTLSKAGVIHVGMRHFVLRLSPSDAGYRGDWFVPSDCKEPTTNGSACAGVRLCPRQPRTPALQTRARRR